MRARLLSLFGRRRDASRDTPRDPRAIRTIAYLLQKHIPAAHNRAVIARLLSSRAADRNLARMAELKPLSTEWMMELYAVLEIVVGESEMDIGELGTGKVIPAQPPSSARKLDQQRARSRAAAADARGWRSLGQTLVRRSWPRRAHR